MINDYTLVLKAKLSYAIYVPLQLVGGNISFLKFCAHIVIIYYIFISSIYNTFKHSPTNNMNYDKLNLHVSLQINIISNRNYLSKNISIYLCFCIICECTKKLRPL